MVSTILEVNHLQSHPGVNVIYTYKVHNDAPVEDLTVTEITDSVFGIVFSGSVDVPNGATSIITTHARLADCTTITNKARSEYVLIT